MAVGMRCSDRCRCREVKIGVTVRTVRRDKKVASVCREVAVVEKLGSLRSYYGDAEDNVNVD